MNRTASPRRTNVLPVSGGTRTESAVSDAAASSSILLRWPIVREIAGEIGVPEVQRRLTHMSPAFLPFLLWIIPHQDPWGPLLVNSVLAITLSLVGVTLYRFRVMARSEGELGVAAVIGYAVPVVAAMLWLPGREEIAMMTLVIIALGDGSATLGGLLIGGRRLPWNRKKTFAGLFCFCLVGTFVSTLAYWGESRPEVTWTMALTCASLSTLAAAVVESLPLAWNDNFRVGMTAALVGATVQIVCFGH